jgi:hypothetical protein
MRGIIVSSTGRISTITGNFIGPAAGELRTAITALEITGVIEINFYIAGDPIIFVSR